MAVLTIVLSQEQYTGPTGIERATDVIHWLVDGENVADLVARTTAHEADRYRTNLWAVTVLAPDADMLGRPGRLWQLFTGEPDEGIVPLLICSCGDAGCMSLIADVEVTSQTVAWRRIRHATVADHQGLEWDGTAPPDVVFDREQYEQELASFTSNDHADGEPPPTQAELAILRDRFASRLRGGSEPG